VPSLRELLSTVITFLGGCRSAEAQVRAFGGSVESTNNNREIGGGGNGVKKIDSTAKLPTKTKPNAKSYAATVTGKDKDDPKGVVVWTSNEVHESNPLGDQGEMDQ
jgi:GMP synthase-like glutamine amidotransferase